MSQLRRLTKRDLHPRPGHCSYCGGPVAPPRRSWCGDACVREYKLLSDPSAMRAEVFNRDGGICSLCGFDTEKLRRVIRWLGRIHSIQRERLERQVEEAAWRESLPWTPYDPGLGDTPVGRKLQALADRGITPHQWDRFWYCTSRLLQGHPDPGPQAVTRWLKAHLGFGKVQHLWEADHTLPVSEGGGAARGVDPLPNLRTLCIRCHQGETTRLAGRRAHRTRAAKQPKPQGCLLVTEES